MSTPQDVSKLLDSSNFKNIFSELVYSLVFHQPEDPLQFIKEVLQCQVNSERDGVPSLSRPSTASPHQRRSPKEYLQEHNITSFLESLLVQTLENSPSDPVAAAYDTVKDVDVILTKDQMGELTKKVKRLSEKVQIARETSTAQRDIKKQEIAYLQKEMSQQQQRWREEKQKILDRVQAIESENDEFKATLAEMGNQTSRKTLFCDLLKHHKRALGRQLTSGESKIWRRLFTADTSLDLSPTSTRNAAKGIIATPRRERDKKEWMRSFNDISSAHFSTPKFISSPRNIEDTPEDNSPLSSAIRAGLLTYDFDMFGHSLGDLFSMLEYMFSDLIAFSELPVPRGALRPYFLAVLREMKNVPFHNFLHAFTVTQMAYSLVDSMGCRAQLSNVERFALLLACLSHDLGHPGQNNAFQVQSRSSHAASYNDISPLENYHAATCFKLLNECGLIQNLDEDSYRRLRSVILTCILATDMAEHNNIVNSWKELQPSLDLGNDDDRLFVLKMIIKMADLGNELRPWKVAKAWADRLVDEFNCQAVEEARRGMSVTQWMKKENVVQPRLQVNFFNMVLIPLYSSVSAAFPSLSLHVERLTLSHDKWRQLYEEIQSTTRQQFD